MDVTEATLEPETKTERCPMTMVDCGGTQKGGEAYGAT
jgi:hypothetical protein